MAKVTYTAPEDDSEVVTYMGVKFFAGRAVELDDDEHAALIAKACTNPLFDVSDTSPAKAKEPASSPAAKGAAAAAAGKPRNVPPAYRGKPAEVEWLTGYDATAED